MKEILETKIASLQGVISQMENDKKEKLENELQAKNECLFIEKLIKKVKQKMVQFKISIIPQEEEVDR